MIVEVLKEKYANDDTCPGMAYCPMGNVGLAGNHSQNYRARGWGYCVTQPSAERFYAHRQPSPRSADRSCPADPDSNFTGHYPLQARGNDPDGLYYSHSLRPS